MTIKYLLNTLKIVNRVQSTGYHPILRGICNGNKMYKTDSFIPSQEVEHARNIMLKNTKYKLWNGQINNATNFIDRICSDNNTSSHAQLLSRFELIARVTEHENVNMQRFTEAIDEIEMNCDTFSDDELWQCLEIFAHASRNTAFSAARSLESLRMALGAVCAVQCTKWNLNQLFVICDIWYTIPNGHQIDFLKSAYKIFEERLNSLSPYQLVQAHFYAARHPENADNLKIFEKQFEKHYQTLSLDELGIIAISTFRSANYLSSKIISYIYQKLLSENTKQLHDLTLVALLKVLREAKHDEALRKKQEALQEKLIGVAAGRSIVSMLHIALLGSKTRIYNNKLLHATVEHFLLHLTDLRLKDMERICFILQLFNFKSKSGIETKLFKAILNELETRTEEIYEYPRARAQCLRYLAYAGFHSQLQIAQTLHPNNLNRVYGHPANYGHEIQFLDTYTKINLNGKYNGPQLNDEQCAVLARQYCAVPPIDRIKRTLTDELDIVLWNRLKEIYKHCEWAHVLPYKYRTGILLVINSKTKRAVDRTKLFPPLFSGQIINKHTLTDADSQLEALFVFIAGEHAYVYQGTEKFLTRGVTFALEQYKILGFQPIVIPYLEWTSTVAKDNYLIRKISEAVAAARLGSRIA